LARSLAVASPIPDAAPVIMAALSFTLSISFSFQYMVLLELSVLTVPGYVLFYLQETGSI
jgi:hypothetical protein